MSPLLNRFLSITERFEISWLESYSKTGKMKGRMLPMSGKFRNRFCDDHRQKNILSRSLFGVLFIRRKEMEDPMTRSLSSEAAKQPKEEG